MLSLLSEESATFRSCSVDQALPPPPLPEPRDAAVEMGGVQDGPPAWAGGGRDLGETAGGGMGKSGGVLGGGL